VPFRRCLWLQYQSLLALQSPVSSVVIRVSSICCSYLSFAAPVSVVHLTPVAPVSFIACDSIIGPSWLQSPVSVVVCVSSQYLSFACVAPVSVGVHGSSLQYLLAFMYLSLVAPAVAPLVVPCGSSIIFCRSSSGSGCRLLVLWLQYLLIAHGSSSISPVVRGSSR